MEESSRIRGKHTLSKSSNHKHFFISLILLFCFILIIFLIYKYFPAILQSLKFKNQDEPTFTSSAALDDIKFIDGSDSIRIDKINIKASSADSSIIEIIFENTANEDSVETSAHFYALDSTGNTIFGMSLTIPSISANSSSNYKILCTNNLSNVKDYIVSVQQ